MVPFVGLMTQAGKVARRIRSGSIRSGRHTVVRPSQLRMLLDQGVSITNMDVEGDTSPTYPSETESQETLHPVLTALHERRRSSYVPGSLSDGRKIGLAIEGGGMGGCVSAAMATALADPKLGLLDSIDCVYGSSAGAVTASYLVARQGPEGLAVFYDKLSADTGKGRDFVDRQKIIALHALMGTESYRPGLDLDILLDIVERGRLALDFDSLLEHDRRQPLGIVSSSPRLGRSVVLSSARGYFGTVPELVECLRASTHVPGLCGMEPVTLSCAVAEKPAGLLRRLRGPRRSRSLPWRGPCEDTGGLVDALVYEPVPYRSALREGCTHVLVMRSKKDGKRMSPNGGFLDVDIGDLLYKRFAEKNELWNMLHHIEASEHRRIYIEDILELNSESARSDDWVKDVGMLSRVVLRRMFPQIARSRLRWRQVLPHRLMTLALHPRDEDVSPLEVKRSKILSAMRTGYARAYAALAEQPNERKFARGLEAAKGVLPRD